MIECVTVPIFETYSIFGCVLLLLLLLSTSLSSCVLSWIVTFQREREREREFIICPSFIEPFIGVNVGTDLSDMPHPTQVVALLKAQQIKNIRLYDADRGMLVALANSGIQVMVSVPNDQLLGIGQSNATAANWVSKNVVAHYPATNITAICVGSEVLSTLPNAAPVLVNSLKYIHSALVASNLDRQIKVSTPLPSSMILDSFPPSQAFFNRSLNSVMIPMLSFLQSTGSYLMLNIYPYYDYMQSNGVIPLDYALLKPLPPNKEAVDANTLVHYSNVFDAMVDAAYFAMSFLNFTNIPVVVTESGWPSKGDSNEPDATLDNANTYNSNLIRHVLNKTGTPKHPGIAVSTLIYELYNEDLKPGTVSEKNWGLFNPNGEPVYILRLTGSGSVLANDTANQTYCTVRDGADPKMLQAALDWACGPGKVDCSALLQGEACYEPDNVIAHATYAFDAYYTQMGKSPDSCDFKGVATITTSNPSHGTCIYPGSSGKINGTLVNVTAPSMNSTTSESPAARDHSVISFTMLVGLFAMSLLAVL
ncbi:Glucan endo-1,3-beta-glucosidase 2 [Linum perenne]